MKPMNSRENNKDKTSDEEDSNGEETDIDGEFEFGETDAIRHGGSLEIAIGQ